MTNDTRVNVQTLYERPITANYSITKPIESMRMGIQGISPASHYNDPTPGEPLVVVPDYQRGRVWTRAQQVAYVEAKLSERIPHQFDIIRLNCPTWAQSSLDEIVGLDPDNLEIVDGLQRVTALVEFVQDRLPVFGGHLASGLTGFRVHAYPVGSGKSRGRHEAAPASGGVV